MNTWHCKACGMLDNATKHRTCVHCGAPKGINALWEGCQYCDHPVLWTVDAEIPICALCQLILNRDHTKLDRVSALMTKGTYDAHAAAQRVTRTKP